MQQEKSENSTVIKNKYLNHNYNVIKVKTSAPNNFVIVPQKISNTNLKHFF